MAAPVMSDEQRRLALAKAVEMRRERAKLCAQIKCQEATLSEVVQSAHESEIAGGLRVLALVQSLPGYGSSKARMLLYRLRISESRRIRGLGVRQRERLLELGL
jgi:hypothetical protein